MNREIKFRGLRSDGLSKDFVFGSLIVEPDNSCWIDWFDNGIRRTTQVIPESVGQFSGALGRKHEEVYEGDRIRAVSRFSCKEIEGEIIFNSQMFCVKSVQGNCVFSVPLFYATSIEMIGNIHETDI